MGNQIAYFQNKNDHRYETGSSFNKNNCQKVAERNPLSIDASQNSHTLLRYYLHGLSDMQGWKPRSDHV